MKQVLRRLWRWVRWPLLVLVIAYVALLVWRYPSYQREQRAKDLVAEIQAQRLSLADVDGSHLPPQPDPKLVDATVEGVDANGNGIRDDVELAIFRKYPNSPYTRAAELQYAMALQSELTKIIDQTTLVAALWQESRAYFCIDQVTSNLSNAVFESRVSETKNLVLNIRQRINHLEETKVRYMTTLANPSRDFCDVDAANLSK